MGKMTTQPTLGSLQARIAALEGMTVLPGPPVVQPNPPKKIGNIVLSWGAFAVSIAALLVPLLVQNLDAEKELNAEQRAAIGPVLNDVSLAEKKLWDAKMELSEDNAGTDAELKTKIAELQNSYLDATYQVLPHGGLRELRAMNGLTQVVLASGYSPDEEGSEIAVSQEDLEAHSARVSEFQRVFKCAVNEQDRSQCDEQ